ncbi:carboxymuconolactone decarboxylase family protein [Dyella sp. LX-66]|uniref:carboxymuconolactone decarboxylase family protein n=1 Tax=unclassified Dyella TaxID=2634549 RepID=UPI001BE0E234|nr:MULTISPECIES: carboxymuconolactone decarboxylase family protein [unclassified Dyella]MBT2117862.1 carboxymuconolactone decarboxylase family protein [Dyella sp. LX-1]MBT2142243.1 carboxymuconolactone decarboxylase family protein [Dyella sp. LX-66]
MSRFNIAHHFKSLQPLFVLSKNLKSGGLEPAMIELVLTRVSQINGCCYCLDMHTKDARAAGETEQRLYLLAGWREAACYSERERSALAWAEALTRLVPGDSVPDALYQQTSQLFNEKEMVDLTLLVTLINSWNRINLAAHTAGGDYQPGMFG